MKLCAACGAEVEDKVRYCPHCGAEIPDEDPEPLRDYWAERLKEDPEERMPPEENEAWLEEVDEEDLRDLNEDAAWVGPDVEEVRPPARRKSPWIVLVCLILAAGAVIFGFYLKHQEKVVPVPGSGIYYGCTSTFEDVTVENRDDYVELRPDGVLRMVLVGQVIEGTWVLHEDQVFTVMGKKEVYAHLREGVLSFRYNGMYFVFALPEKMDSVLKAEKQEHTAIPEETDQYSQWNGEYYGSFVLSEGTGGWAYDGIQCHSVCGRIQADEDGTGFLALWNEENKPDDRFLMADVYFTEGTTDWGKMSVQWGKLFEMDMGPGEWVVDPGKSPCSHLENMLYFRGKYIDPSDPQSTFIYEIFLRPWGQRWEDAESYYEDPWMIPPTYYEWYLPLVEAGQRMPDHF